MPQAAQRVGVSVSLDVSLWHFFTGCTIVNHREAPFGRLCFTSSKHLKQIQVNIPNVFFCYKKVVDESTLYSRFCFEQIDLKLYPKKDAVVGCFLPIPSMYGKHLPTFPTEIPPFMQVDIPVPWMVWVGVEGDAPLPTLRGQWATCQESQFAIRVGAWYCPNNGTLHTYKYVHTAPIPESLKIWE